ncbi:MAG: hypothetical protein ABIG34_00990 [Candidatus Peregrinibacteria bacterium]
MRILYIDLASHNGLIACCDERSVVASEPVDHRIDDHELVPFFEKILSSAGWKTEDLTHVACVIGPGGFMSLRVVVGFANTLIHQLKISGTGIHISDLLQARASDQDFVWLHSTKKQELFVRGFGSFVALWPEAVHLTTDVFLQQVPQGAVWAGELIPEHRDLFREKQLTSLILQPITDVLPSFLSSRSYTQNLLEPWYGRGW